MIDPLELRSILAGGDDHRSAILTIDIDAGGVESQDVSKCCGCIFYAEGKGLDVSLLRPLAGEVAGIQNVTISIHGEFVFGYLQAESGVHPLVRISPFRSNLWWQTSFVSVFCIPGD